MKVKNITSKSTSFTAIQNVVLLIWLLKLFLSFIKSQYFFILFLAELLFYYGFTQQTLLWAVWCFMAILLLGFFSAYHNFYNSYLWLIRYWDFMIMWELWPRKVVLIWTSDPKGNMAPKIFNLFHFHHLHSNPIEILYLPIFKFIKISVIKVYFYEKF